MISAWKKMVSSAVAAALLAAPLAEAAPASKCCGNATGKNLLQVRLVWGTVILLESGWKM